MRPRDRGPAGSPTGRRGYDPPRPSEEAARSVADDVRAQRWLSRLRDGTASERVAARRGLAHLLEQRGMLEEAIGLLEENVRAGVRNGETFRWLARLYREHGDTARSLEALAEAMKPRATAKPPPLPVRPDRSAVPPTPWTADATGLFLVTILGLGAAGVGLWWVAALLRP